MKLKNTLQKIISITVIVSSLWVPLAAHATAQLTSRKVVATSSGASDTSVTYTATFTAASTAMIESFRVQVCNSPLQSAQPCTAVTGFSWGAGTISVQQDGITTFSHPYAPSVSGTDNVLSHATGNLINAGEVITLAFSTITNPSTINLQYFLRITSCTDTTCAVNPGVANIDFGAVAMSSSQSVVVAATVQENLDFCVGTAGVTCAALTATTGQITLSPDPLGVTTYSQGSSAMIAGTNAASGYVITYQASNAAPVGVCTTTNVGFCDPVSGRVGTDVNNFVASSGNLATAEQFGLNLAVNTVGGVGGLVPNGAIPFGGSGITVPGAYNVGDQYSFNRTGPVTVATASGPTAQTNFTVSYISNVTSVTKPGAYSVRLNYICTSTF